jgi:hypothetical protein
MMKLLYYVWTYEIRSWNIYAILFWAAAVYIRSPFSYGIVFADLWLLDGGCWKTEEYGDNFKIIRNLG